MTKKKLIAIIIGILLIIGLVAGYYVGQAIEENNRPIVGDPFTVEAAKDPLPEAADYFSKLGSLEPGDVVISYEGTDGTSWRVTLNEDGIRSAGTTGVFRVLLYDTKKDVTYENQLTVIDKTAPVLEVQDVTVSFEGSIDLTDFIVNASDLVDQDNLIIRFSEEYDFESVGTQELTIEVLDQSGNSTSATASFTREEKPKPPEPTPPPVAPDLPYYIRVNRAADCVTIYAKDESGEYTVPVRAMVCSTGRDTPLGTYSSTARYEWLSLVGGVQGQYALRIVGSIAFHSVPYYSRDKGNLESEEYNKLGTHASLGCVRLCVADVKWIYDNCPRGTIVTLYDDPDNPGPLGKPTPITIDLTSPNKGWDPTDPDPNNPWHQQDAGAES